VKSSTTIRGSLPSVSPSTYGRLKAWKEGKACALQLLWAGEPPLAPVPSAKLGDVVHLVMEAAPSLVDEESVANFWEDKCREVDDRLRANWVTRGLVPLALKTKGYELRKLMALRLAASLPTSSHGLSKASGAGQAACASIAIREEALVSLDGKLRGRVDLVEHRTEGWVLVDFKSGEVLEDDEEGSPRIKGSYEFQILLYAALLLEAKGIEICSGVLKTLDGREHQIPVNRTKAEGAAQEARQLLEEFNSHCGGGNASSLAAPMPSSWENHVFGCSGCLFRPSCTAYIVASKPSVKGTSWPRDVIGTVVAASSSRGSKRIDMCRDGETEGRTVSVLLNDSVYRHPILDDVRAGDRIGIFDLAQGRTIFAEGPRTCIYKISVR